VLWPLETRISSHHRSRVETRLLQEHGVAPEIGDAKARQPGLQGSPQLAGTPRAQVRLGQSESIVGLGQERKTLACLGAWRGADEQIGRAHV